MEEEKRQFKADIQISEEELEKIKKKKEEKPAKSGWKYEVWDMVKTVIVCAVAAWLITHFIVRPVQVDGMSMYPTLDNKEIGIMNIIDKSLHDINRYDVVVVSDAAITNGDNWVKRVIGLPGDTIYAKNDVVYVNGQAIEEPYLDTDYVNNIRSRGNQFTADFEKVTLQDDEYFLMGDNRVVSHDSRADNVGPFKKADFVGKDVYVIYPFNDIRTVRNGEK